MPFKEQYDSIVAGLLGILLLIVGWWSSRMNREIDRLKEDKLQAASTRVQLEKLSAEIHTINLSVGRAEAQLIKNIHEMQLQMIEQQRASIKEVYAHIANVQSELRGEIRENRRQTDFKRRD